MNARAKYLELARSFGLDHRHHRVRVQCDLIERGLLADRTVASLISSLYPLVEQQKRRPNYLFHSPQYAELYPHGPPELVIGHLAENPEVPVGISLCNANFHIFAGQANTGKTTAIRNLILRIAEHNEKHPDKCVSMVILQLKAGDFADLRSHLGDRCIHLNLHTDAVLGLNAPESVPANIWINQLIPCFCVRAGLQFGGITLANVIRWLLPQLNPERKPPLLWPDPQLILDVLACSKSGAFASKGDYTRSLIQVLEGLVSSSGELFRNANGCDIQRDVFDQGKWAVVLEMENLAPDWLRNFVIDLLFLQLLCGRMARGHRPGYCDCMFFVDEGDAWVSAKEEARFPSGMGICSKGSRLAVCRT